MIWLDNSRILAIFAVVLLHVSGGIVLRSEVGTEYWWIANVYDSIVRWCVPVLVMISGALLLEPKKQEKITTFYTKRRSKILIPIVVWSIFSLIWTFAKNIVKGNELTIIDLLKKLLSGKPHYHMWFLYMILILYLFTPFFRKIIKQSNKKELLLFIVITFIMSAINFAYEKFVFGTVRSTLFINWFLLYIPYFFIGYFIRQDNHTPSKVLLWSIFIISVVLTFIGCYIFTINISLNKGLYFYGDLSVTVIPMSISIMYILKTWNKPIINASFTKQLSLLTFGIYLMHPMLLEAINYIKYGAISFYPIISIPVIAFFIFLVSAGISLIIYKIPYLKRTI